MKKSAITVVTHLLKYKNAKTNVLFQQVAQYRNGTLNNSSASSPVNVTRALSISSEPILAVTSDVTGVALPKSVSLTTTPTLPPGFLSPAPQQQTVPRAVDVGTDTSNESSPVRSALHRLRNHSVSSDSDSELSNSVKEAEAMDLSTVRRRRRILEEISNDENDIDVEAMSGDFILTPLNNIFLLDRPANKNCKTLCLDYKQIFKYLFSLRVI